MKLEDLTLDVEQHVDVQGSLDDVFKSVLHRFGSGCAKPDGESLQLQIEPFAGGRWFRDRGEGIQHLWGHVQTIKAPTLLELSGPMFMSYPAINHVQYRLKAEGGGTRLTFLHRAMGLILPEHRDGMPEGWEHWLKRIRELAERKKNAAGTNTKETKR